MILTKKKQPGVHSLLVGGVLKHYSEKNKLKQVEPTFVDYKKIDFFLIKSLIVIIKNYLKNICLGKKYYLIRVDNIEIGKYATSSTLRNVNVNLKPISFFMYFHFNLLKSVFVYAAVLRISKDVKAIFLGEVFYLDGIWIDYYLPRDRVAVYMTLQPYNFLCITKQYKNLSSFLESGFEDIALAAVDDKIVEDYMYCRLRDPKASIFYYDVESEDFSVQLENTGLVNLVIYLHSFTDIQMARGFDGFKSVYEWMVFTINKISNFERKVNLFVKVHPNFYMEKTSSKIGIMDQEVWEHLKKKLPSNVCVVDKKVTNYDFLRNFSKKDTILISHHGNAVVEGAFLGFKSISSFASPWYDNYEFTNIWRSPNEYSRLIEIACQDPSSLKSPNKSVLAFISDCYLRPNGSYSENSYIEIVARNLKSTVKNLIRNPDISYSNEEGRIVVKELVKSITEV